MREHVPEVPPSTLLNLNRSNSNTDNYLNFKTEWSDYRVWSFRFYQFNIRVWIIITNIRDGVDFLRLLPALLVHNVPLSIGHRGAYGHEFLDFEIDSTGKLKYHNNSEYKSDQLIRKQGKNNTIIAYVSKTVIDEMKRIVVESGILDCKDT